MDNFKQYQHLIFIGALLVIIGVGFAFCATPSQSADPDPIPVSTSVSITDVECSCGCGMKAIDCLCQSAIEELTKNGFTNEDIENHLKENQ